MRLYKRKRKKEEQTYDSPPRHLRLEGAERGRAKRLIKQQIDEMEEDKDLDIIDMINKEAKEVLGYK